MSRPASSRLPSTVAAPSISWSIVWATVPCCSKAAAVAGSSAPRRQRLPARPAEAVTEGSVGEPGLRDGNSALQLWHPQAPPGEERAVDLGVYLAQGKRSHAVDAGEVPRAGLQAGQVGLDHLLVTPWRPGRMGWSRRLSAQGRTAVLRVQQGKPATCSCGNHRCPADAKRYIAGSRAATGACSRGTGVAPLLWCAACP